MTYHTSEVEVESLANDVLQLSKKHPRLRVAAWAIHNTAMDKTLPIEYRKQLALRFLKKHKSNEKETVAD